MYVEPNFKSKAELKRAIAKGQMITVFSPGAFPAPFNGKCGIEGPHFPKAHTWYAEVEIVSGRVTRVIS